MQLTWSYDDIHIRRAIKYDLLVFLSHAAHHTDRGGIGASFFQLPNGAKRACKFFLLRVHEHCRCCKESCRPASVSPRLHSRGRSQISDHHLAVQDIHLAADRFDVNFLDILLLSRSEQGSDPVEAIRFHGSICGLFRKGSDPLFGLAAKFLALSRSTDFRA